MVEETGVPGENHRPVVSHWQTLSHNVVSSTPRQERVYSNTLFYHFYCFFYMYMYIIRLFYRQVYFISKDFVGV